MPKGQFVVFELYQKQFGQPTWHGFQPMELFLVVSVRFTCKDAFDVNWGGCRNNLDFVRLLGGTFGLTFVPVEYSWERFSKFFYVKKQTRAPGVLQGAPPK